MIVYRIGKFYPGEKSARPVEGSWPYYRPIGLAVLKLKELAHQAQLSEITQFGHSDISPKQAMIDREFRHRDTIYRIYEVKTDGRFYSPMLNQ